MEPGWWAEGEAGWLGGGAGVDGRAGVPRLFVRLFDAALRGERTTATPLKLPRHSRGPALLLALQPVQPEKLLRLQRRKNVGPAHGTGQPGPLKPAAAHR